MSEPNLNPEDFDAEEQLRKLNGLSTGWLGIKIRYWVIVLAALLILAVGLIPVSVALEANKQSQSAKNQTAQIRQTENSLASIVSQNSQLVLDNKQVSLNIRHLALHDCYQVEHVKAVVRNVLAASAKTLGVRGSAGYAYYHSHHSELLSARAQIKAEVRSFARQPCP